MFLHCEGDSNIVVEMGDKGKANTGNLVRAQRLCPKESCPPDCPIFKATQENPYYPNIHNGGKERVE